MAKKADPIQAAPADAGVSQKRSPLLTFLTVVLILIGVIDAALWALVGYYALSAHGGTAADVGGGEPAGNREPVNNESSDGDEKRDALIAYIQQMAEVGTLETEMLESFNSVTGTNYTDDDAVYAEITARTLPLCQQMNEKVLAIVPGDSEIEELNKIYQDFAANWLNILEAMISDPSSQDMAQAAEVNNQINETNALTADFNRALQSLAAERNVSLNG